METSNKWFGWTWADYRELIPNNFRGLLRIFSSLRVRNFRLYFIGQCISLSGAWIQNIAMSWLVYRITGSVLLLATVTFVNQIPSLIITPFAGVMVDRVDKYKVLKIVQWLFMTQALILAALTLSGVIEVWQILALSLFSGMVTAVEAPTRQSFYTKLVSKDDMSNAVALNSTSINGSRFIGPTVGGIVISLVGEGWCFLINGLAYSAVIIALQMMKVKPYKRPASVNTNVWDEFREGFSYVKDFLPIRAVLIFVAAFCLFGLPFMTIMPAFVKDILGGDSRTLGYVMSSIGAGAMTAALYLAARKRVKGLGKVVTLAAILFGVSLIVLSQIKVLAVAYIVCVPIGFGFVATLASSNTLLQTMVDDDKRGRVMGFYTMAFAGMAPIGSMLQGAVAKAMGLPMVLLIAGAISVVAALIYEYYRPAVRRAARDAHINKAGVVPEIANAINVRFTNPF